MLKYKQEIMTVPWPVFMGRGSVIKNLLYGVGNCILGSQIMGALMDERKYTVRDIEGTS